MSARKELLTIEYHTDDDTGMYSVGEIDFGISGELDNYIAKYGQKGVADLMNTMGYLIYEIQRKWRLSNEQSSTTSALR